MFCLDLFKFFVLKFTALNTFISHLHPLVFNFLYFFLQRKHFSRSNSFHNIPSYVDIKRARFQKSFKYVQFPEFCVNMNKSPLYCCFLAKVPRILKISTNGGGADCHFLIKERKKRRRKKSRNLLFPQPNMQSIVMTSSGHENKGGGK